MSHYGILNLVGDHPIWSFLIVLTVFEGVEAVLKAWRGKGLND